MPQFTAKSDKKKPSATQAPKATQAGTPATAKPTRRSGIHKQIEVGSKVMFHRLDGKICADTVRGLFIQDVLLEPMARNQRRAAVILTEHSWCYVEDIVTVESAPTKSRKVKALPDYDTPQSKVPPFRKVFYADHHGRIMRDACDVFATRDQACVYWWMLAREGVVAFLSCGLDGDRSNKSFHGDRTKEPAELVASIDWAHEQYKAEGGEVVDEYPWFSRATSVFDTPRA